MGLFDFFRQRRERESASHAGDRSHAAPADTESAAVVGEQVGGAGEFQFGGAGDVQGVAGMLQGLDFSAIGPAIQKAIEDGNVTIEQGPTQTLDLRGSGLREEIMGIMKQHGIDPAAGTAGQSIDASGYGDMQKQILALLAEHGVDPGASGTTIDVPKPDDK